MPNTPKRTKEQIIQASNDHVDIMGSLPEAITNLVGGASEGALDAMAHAAARTWKVMVLKFMDFSMVDDQGSFSEPGTDLFYAVTWKAGEHVDDVLMRGASAVADRARQVLKASEILGITEEELSARFQAKANEVTKLLSA